MLLVRQWPFDSDDACCELLSHAAAKHRRLGIDSAGDAVILKYILSDETKCSSFQILFPNSHGAQKNLHTNHKKGLASKYGTCFHPVLFDHRAATSKSLKLRIADKANPLWCSVGKLK